MTKLFTPALFIALSNVIVFAVINGFQLATQEPIYYVNKWIMHGGDYQDFYQASAHILNAQSPYLVSRYVTPPLFALANAPLAMLGFKTAWFIFSSLIPFTILFSYLLIYRALKESDVQDDDLLLFSGLLVILFSYPFYFLFERGNIDGVVLLCMCAGLYLLPQKAWLGGLLLASAILFKLYPLLLLASLFFSRRWKPFLWTCAWLLLLIFLTLPYWDDYFTSSFHRAYYFRLDENGSLVNTIMIIIVFVRLLVLGDVGNTFDEYSSLYTAVLYGLLVVIMLYADYKLSHRTTEREKLSDMLLYFPFMVAIPQLVYHYEFVVVILLLPVLNFMWKDTLSKQKKYCLVLVAIGVSLSQWQAIALYLVTGNMLAHYIPGFGLMIAILGISVYKFLQMRDEFRQLILEPISQNPSKFSNIENLKPDI